jgi:hypothetical protein
MRMYRIRQEWGSSDILASAFLLVRMYQYPSLSGMGFAIRFFGNWEGWRAGGQQQCSTRTTITVMFMREGQVQRWQ